MDSTKTGGSRATAHSPPLAGLWRRVRARVMDDPYVFYTASLVPVAAVVASLAGQAGHVPLAIGVGAFVVAVEALLGSIGRRRGIESHLGWQLLRLLPPLFFASFATRFIGGPSLPLISLYVPVVAAAAAAGRVQGLVAGSVAGVVLVGPELGNLGSPTAVALRSVTITGVTVLVGLGTRRIVQALEQALAAARQAVVAERRRARQIEALESVGDLLAAAGPSSALLGDVVDVVARGFGYPHVSIYIGDAERGPPGRQQRVRRGAAPLHRRRRRRRTGAAHR